MAVTDNVDNPERVPIRVLHKKQSIPIRQARIRFVFFPHLPRILQLLDPPRESQRIPPRFHSKVSMFIKGVHRSTVRAQKPCYIIGYPNLYECNVQEKKYVT